MIPAEQKGKAIRFVAASRRLMKTSKLRMKVSRERTVRNFVSDTISRLRGLVYSGGKVDGKYFRVDRSLQSRKCWNLSKSDKRNLTLVQQNSNVPMERDIQTKTLNTSKSNNCATQELINSLYTCGNPAT